MQEVLSYTKALLFRLKEFHQQDYSSEKFNKFLRISVNFFIPLIVSGNTCYCKSHAEPSHSNIVHCLLCLYALPDVPAITSEVILLFLNLYLHFLFSIWNPPFLFLLWPYPIPKYISWQMKSSYTFPGQEQKPGSYCERNSISTENEDFKRMSENLYLKLHFLLNTEFPKNRMTLNIRQPLIFCACILVHEDYFLPPLPTPLLSHLPPTHCIFQSSFPSHIFWPFLPPIAHLHSSCF